MKKYISKGDWFDEGTEAFPCYEITDDMDNAVFKGIKDGKEDEELCHISEFIICEC